MNSTIRERRITVKYIQLDIHTSRAGLEPIEAALMGIGITDMVVTDPMDVTDILDKEHDYDWDYVSDEFVVLQNEEPMITLYFDGDECGPGYAQVQQVDLALEGVRQDLMDGVYGEDADFGSLTSDMSVHDDEEWKDNWKEFFKPAKISERIVVKPTWESYELSEEEKSSGVKVLEIDPGMAFGTGTHETTSLCVKLMEEYMKPGDKVLDVGCGSGILEIAGALLGASECLGIEIDPVAVDVSKENIELNKVSDVCSAQYGDLTKGIDYKANVVVANLMADLVMHLSESVARHMLPGGYYISSGILDEKMITVVDDMRMKGFKIMEVKKDGMWVAIVAQHN